MSQRAKVIVLKPEHLGSVPRGHAVEGGNLSLKVSDDLHIYSVAPPYSRVHTHTASKCKKKKLESTKNHGLGLERWPSG